MRFVALFIVSMMLPLSAEAIPTLGNKQVKTLTFRSADGIKVTADLYAPHIKAPFIVLFHQAGWSRGEYQEIALQLNQKGFNALAVDQRSGGAVNGVKNQTARRAKAAKKGTRYLDAYADMQAAVAFVRKSFAPETLIVWGSSYSAALVFRLVAEHQHHLSGALAFAPGEYLRKKGKMYVQGFAKRIKIPFFVTSARSEHGNWKALFDAMPSKHKASYLPQTRGQHGSRALWRKWKDSAGYWKAVDAFLARFKR